MQGLLRRLNSHNRLPAIFAVVAGLFIVSQTITATHNAAYGDEPHDHNGVACVVSLSAKDADNVLAAGGAAMIVVFAVWRAAAIAAQSERAALAIRGANPRGPPAQ